MFLMNIVGHLDVDYEHQDLSQNTTDVMFQLKVQEGPRHMLEELESSLFCDWFLAQTEHWKNDCLKCFLTLRSDEHSDKQGNVRSRSVGGEESWTSIGDDLADLECDEIECVEATGVLNSFGDGLGDDLHFATLLE